MQIYNIMADNLRPIVIGFEGENSVVAVKIDFSEWSDEFGEGVLQIVVKPQDADAPYIVIPTCEGNLATWTISASDTAIQGAGRLQLVYNFTGGTKKSKVANYVVHNSLDADGTVDPPSPYSTWFDILINLGSETLRNAQSAEHSAGEAAASAAEAATHASNAETSASAAASSASEAGGYANSASALASNAQHAASDAADSAVEALSYSESASDSATTASNKATEAAGSASAAADSASSAETYASNASTKATEAFNSATRAGSYASQAELKADAAERFAILAAEKANDSADSKIAAAASASQASDSADSASSSATLAGNAADSATQMANSALDSLQRTTQLEQSAESYASSAQTHAGNAGNSATNAATSATNAATSASEANTYLNGAQTAVSHYPKIQGGYWYVWDATNNLWANTGVKAVGQDYILTAQDKVDIASSVNDMFVVEVSSGFPDLTCEENTRYICGEVSGITITPPVTGVVDIIFTSGSSPAVLTLPNTVKMPDWFDSSSLETDTIYEINITDGVYGVVTTWQA